jgi:hypothetical protein
MCSLALRREHNSLSATGAWTEPLPVMVVNVTASLFVPGVSCVAPAICMPDSPAMSPPVILFKNSDSNVCDLQNKR